MRNSKLTMHDSAILIVGLCRLLQARRGFQAMVSAHVAGDSLSTTGAAVVEAAALFEQLAAGELPGASGGLAAAIGLVEQVLSAADPEVTLAGCPSEPDGVMAGMQVPDAASLLHLNTCLIDQSGADSAYQLHHAGFLRVCLDLCLKIFCCVR